MNMMPDDERLLLIKISQGNRLAFKQLYDHTSSLLYAIALKILKNHHAAEEILQEVFMTLWHAAEQYNVERGSVKTWLSTITRNRCIDRIRRMPKENLFSSDDIELVSHNNDPLQQALNDDHQNMLLICFDALDEKQRTCVSMAFFEGMTHQQIATHLTIPLGSAKTWIRRGLDLLKKCMGAAV